MYINGKCINFKLTSHSNSLSRETASVKARILFMVSSVGDGTVLLTTLGTRNILKNEEYLQVEIISSVSGCIGEWVFSIASCRWMFSVPAK